MQTRTLVLGGSGFIGSHLVEKLLSTGRIVHVVDNHRYCYEDNLDDVVNHPSLTIESHDACLFNFIKPFQWDEIYHLAGVVSTSDFVADPVEAFRVSIEPLSRMLDYQRKYNPDVKLLFASSSEVYGNAKILPTPETYVGRVDFTGPRSGYDEGKRAGETMIVGYQKLYAGKCARVRLFNTFGPRMRANGRLVPTMVLEALESNQIRVNGTGMNTRTLLYVSDCIQALMSAMELQHPDPINIGGNAMQTILNIAQMVKYVVKDATGKTVDIKHVEEVPHDIFMRQPDIHLAAKLLDWHPTTPIHDGVLKVVNYWKEK